MEETTSVRVGTRVQALDTESGKWRSGCVVDVDLVWRKVNVHFDNFPKKWNTWISIGNMEDEVSSFLGQLDDDTFSAVTIRGNRESRNCLPGPRLFSPTVEQKLAVLLLEIYDQNNVLSQGVLSRLTAGEQQMQGESLIRIMEILVSDFHLHCLDKGFTRTIVPERLVDRRQPKGTQASEESRKLTGGDCFFHRVNGRIFDASVYVNDPFLGMIITSNKRCIPYEDIVLTGYHQSRHTASCTPEETGSEVESFQLYLSESGNESDTGRDPTWTLPPKSPPEVVVPSTMGTRTTSIRKRKREDMQQEQERTKKRTNPAKKLNLVPDSWKRTGIRPVDECIVSSNFPTCIA